MKKNEEGSRREEEVEGENVRMRLYGNKMRNGRERVRENSHCESNR